MVSDGVVTSTQEALQLLGTDPNQPLPNNFFNWNSTNNTANNTYSNNSVGSYNSIGGNIGNMPGSGGDVSSSSSQYSHQNISGGSHYNNSSSIMSSHPGGVGGSGSVSRSSSVTSASFNFNNHSTNFNSHIINSINFNNNFNGHGMPSSSGGMPGGNGLHVNNITNRDFGSNSGGKAPFLEFYLLLLLLDKLIIHSDSFIFFICSKLSFFWLLILTIYPYYISNQILTHYFTYFYFAVDGVSLVDSSNSGEMVRLADHPRFRKYFSLLSGGVGREEVQRQMTDDG